MATTKVLETCGIYLMKHSRVYWKLSRQLGEFSRIERCCQMIVVVFQCPENPSPPQKHLSRITRLFGRDVDYIVSKPFVASRPGIKQYLCSFQMRFFVSHTDTKATSFVAFRTSSCWCSNHKEFSPKIIPIICQFLVCQRCFFLPKNWKGLHLGSGITLCLVRGVGRCFLVWCEVFDLDYMPTKRIEENTCKAHFLGSPLE